MMNIHDYKKELAKELNIADIPDDRQERILNQVAENIIQAVTGEILHRLPETKKQEFLKLLEAGDEKKINSFLETNIANLQDIITTKAKEELEESKKLFA